MNVTGSRKLFRKEVINAKEEKVDICSRIKDGNGRLVQGEDEVRIIWKGCFENMYDIDTQVAVHMCGKLEEPMLR